MNEPSEHEENSLAISIDNLTKAVDRLNRGLYGDSENDMEGLVSKVQRHETWIQALNSRMLMLFGSVLTITGLGKLWEWFHESTK
jgi:hypothetical protein